MLEELSKEDVLISDVSDKIGDEKSEEDEAVLEVIDEEELKEEVHLEVVDEEEKEVLEEKVQN